MKKLGETELLSAINSARDDAMAADESELVVDRANAMDRYFGRPYGNEVEGRSQVVSKDLAETVDWIMPSLLRIFAGGDSVVEFNPVGPEDEAQAQQETDYVNYVVTQENSWFLVGHDWFKDALLLRNGYVKWYVEDYKRPKFEEYTGLDEDQLVEAVKDAEVVEQRKRTEDGATLYDLKVRSYEEGRKVCIEAVPSEELTVHRRCRGSVQSAPYVEHTPQKTRSDLIEMGLSKDFVEELPSASAKHGSDVQARNPLVTEDERFGSYDHSMDVVDYRECYILIDYDGDGVAELRRVVVCGNKIPPGREWNREVDGIPFASLTPNRIPHRHIGRSMEDELSDLAEIKTTVWRQMLDNIYLTNNSRLVVNENVNLSDLLVSRPGGVVRTKGMPAADCVPLMTAPIINQTLPILGAIDAVKEFRVGVGRNTQGLDSDTLKQSTKGAYLASLGQANQKIEMIARMFAETGVKDMFLGVHRTLRKNADKAKIVRLRNQYVPVDPRSWNSRYDLTVSVGLGTGSTEEQVQKVQALAMAQQQLAAMGLVGPEEAYATFETLCKALGFKNPSRYSMDPQGEKFKAKSQQPPPKDPVLQAKELDVQARSQESQQSGALKKYELDQNAQLAREKAQAEMANAERDRQAQAEIEQLRARVDLMMVDMKNQVAQLGQLVKVHGDAQNRMALGGPAATSLVDTDADSGPSVSDLFAGLQQTQAALADGVQGLAMAQAELARGQNDMAALLAKPKQIAIQRDSDGRAVGATSKVSE